MLKTLKRLNPELSNWILEDGYGRVLSRPDLSLVERELIAVGVLAALGWKRQLHSHIVGSLNVGATKRDLSSVLRAITPLVVKQKSSSFRSQLIEAFRRSAGENT